MAPGPVSTCIGTSLAPHFSSSSPSPRNATHFKLPRRFSFNFGMLADVLLFFFSFFVAGVIYVPGEHEFGFKAENVVKSESEREKNKVESAS